MGSNLTRERLWNFFNDRLLERRAELTTLTQCESCGPFSISCSIISWCAAIWKGHNLNLCCELKGKIWIPRFQNPSWSMQCVTPIYCILDTIYQDSLNCKRNLETGQLSSNNLSLLYVTTTVERHRIVGVELYDTKATFSFLIIAGFIGFSYFYTYYQRNLLIC